MTFRRAEGRYARFAGEPSLSGAGGFPAGRGGLGTGPAKRRSHNLLGWAVQWATAQMLGTFLSAPADVPQGVAALVAEQLETGARHEGL
ncbi:DUF4158 domain-containing protein [Streptomyces sp. NBC_01352]|uniref:DUF4158 domain-containing protein n=1 Tax=Streptomyces TaxID=1883 RepID=UPI002E377CAD|nr:DUF4158 domain-containing protein [Streptomyces sp. NBC_01352]